MAGFAVDEQEELVFEGIGGGGVDGREVETDLADVKVRNCEFVSH